MVAPLTLRTDLAGLEDARTLAGSDEAERQRIRQALRRYMTEQKIGVPALRDRIINADKPRHREIPLSTLQRFLAGSHQTQDMYVSVCRDFAAKLPWYGEERAVALLGEGLAHFFEITAPGTSGPGAGQPRTIPPGVYESDLPARARVRIRKPGSEERSEAASDWLGPEPSQMTVSEVPGKSYFELRERIRQDALSEGRAFECERREAFEGVLFATGQGLYALMRSTLTRLPKGYGITPLRITVNDRPAFGFTCICLIPYAPHGIPASAVAAGSELTFTPVLESLS